MSDLIDREAFIEHERKLYCENCDRRRGMRNGKLGGFVYEIGEAPCRACSIHDTLTDLEDFPAALRWVKVEENPPRENGRYFVWEASGFAYVDEWNDGAWTIAGSVPYARVTHWMPIYPPKEDA